MFEPVHEISIVVAALVAFAVGNIWFSPLFFGKMIAHSVHTTENETAAGNGMSVRILIGMLCANLVLLFVVAEAIAIAKKYLVPLPLLGVLLGLSACAVVAHGVLSAHRSLQYFLVQAGYVIVVIVGGTFIISLWPW